MMDETLSLLESLGTYRSVNSMEGLLDFSSNDYLGFATSPHLRAKLIHELELGCPIGATGSALISGYTPYHERVESFLAKTLQSESALLFSSGYLANLGLITALSVEGAEFFSDELIHSSFIDGLRLNDSRKVIFRHNDMDHLEYLLKQSSSLLKIILTESVFSMDGDLAPLEDLVGLSQKHDALLVLDEAHATGLYGRHGLGCTEDLDHNQLQLVSVHTGGKALGGQGAFILSDRKIRQILINRARSYIYTTALSPLMAIHLEFAVKEILLTPNRGPQILALAKRLRSLLPQDSLRILGTSQIVPIVLGSNTRALTVANALLAKKIGVRAIRSPTVKAGSERLRITIRYPHTIDQILHLAQALEEVL